MFWNSDIYRVDEASRRSLVAQKHADGKIGACTNFQYAIRQQCPGNIHLGGHFDLNPCLRRLNRSIIWRILLGPTVLPQDFPRAEAPRQRESESHLRPLPGVPWWYHNDSGLPTAVTLRYGE